MQTILIEKLKTHPMNGELFDDIGGNKWDSFVESIENHGVREAIIITQDMIIVSGHQRVRACKQLGIATINCEIRFYNNEDEVLYDLIIINLDQRGEIKDSPIKEAKRIKELKRLRDATIGRFQGKPGEIGGLLNKIDRDIQRTEKLLELIPEFQKMVGNGELGVSVASRIIAGLSHESQQELFSQCGDSISSMTQKEVEELLKENETLKNRLKNINDSPVEKALSLSERDEYEQKIQESTQKVRQLYEGKEEMSRRVKEVESTLKRLKEQPILSPEAFYANLKATQKLLQNFDLGEMLAKITSKSTRDKCLEAITNIKDELNRLKIG